MIPLLMRLLPPEDRDAVLGDLREEASDRKRRSRSHGALWWLTALAGILVHVHREPYRDTGGRAELLVGVAVGAALLLAVQLSGFAPGPVFDLDWDPVSRAVLSAWAASHIVSAVAAGLLVGHAPWSKRPTVAGLHAVVIVALIAVGRATSITGAVWVLVTVVAAAWLGRAGRGDPGWTRGRATP